jgi:hypothetical protein
MTHGKETADPHRLDNRLLLLTEQLSKALQQQIQQRNAKAKNHFKLQQVNQQQLRPYRQQRHPRKTTPWSTNRPAAWSISSWLLQVTGVATSHEDLKPLYEAPVGVGVSGE